MNTLTNTLTKKKIILTAVSVIMLVGLTVLLCGVFKTISTEEGRIVFKNMIIEMGVPGCFLLLGLNIAQVFLFFFPGEPIELLAGMCYGTLGGLLVIYIGALISSCIIFFLVRRIGKRSIYDLIGKEKVERIEQSRLYNNKNAEKILLFLFLLPGTPKDLLVYVGALLPIKATRFILLSTAFRFVGIITSTLIGKSLAEGDMRLAVIVLAATIVVSLTVIFFIRKKDDIREIMDIDKQK